MNRPKKATVSQLLRALSVYERAVREHEWRGSHPPDELAGIDSRFKKAKARVKDLIRTLADEDPAEGDSGPEGK